MIGADGKNRTFWRSGKEFYTVFYKKVLKNIKNMRKIKEMGTYILYKERKREREKGSKRGRAHAK